MDARCQEHNHPEKTLKGGRRESQGRCDGDGDSSVPDMLGDYSGAGRPRWASSPLADRGAWKNEFPLHSQAPSPTSTLLVSYSVNMY